MEIVVIAFMIIIVIGAIIASVAGVALFITLWWIAIPIVGALVGGWLGLFFGLGLVAIISLIILTLNQ